MAAKMLAAYYSRGCDSRQLFSNFAIAGISGFEKDLNSHNVIYLDMQWFQSVAKDKGMAEQMVSYMQLEVIKEIQQQYPQIVSGQENSLPEVLLKIHF